MPANVPLSETVYTTLNGSGSGSAKLGPLSAREVWHPSNVSVNEVVPTGGSITNDASCIISVGDVNTKAARDTSFFGSTGDSTDKCNADVIKSSSYIWADWSGGDAGAIVRMTVTGTKDV